MKNTLLIISLLFSFSAFGADKPTMKSVSGTYELKKDGNTFRLVLLKNGIVEYHFNGEKLATDSEEWKISKKGELYVTASNGDAGVYRINKDRSITIISEIYGGKRTDRSNSRQYTYKRIK